MNDEEPKMKRQVSTDLIYLQHLTIWSVSRLLDHVIFHPAAGVCTQRDASASLIATTALGSYGLCSPTSWCKRQALELSAGSKVRKPGQLPSKSSFSHAAAQIIPLWGLLACVMFLHRCFLDNLLTFNIPVGFAEQDMKIYVRHSAACQL